MKRIILSFALAATSINAFVVETKKYRLQSFLQGTTVRPDSSEAIQEALRISKEFGASSPKARIAWETVEEMDSSTRYTPLQQAPREAISPTDDYKYQTASLTRLLEESQETLNQIQALAKNLQELELQDPNLTKLQNSGLKQVLQEAKAAAELYGSNSVEANQAWEDVEDCVDSVNGQECSVESMYRYNAAALKAHHYYDAVVDRAFLQEAVEAVDTLSRLRKFVAIENSRLLTP
jgi:hypothetical protein